MPPATVQELTLRATEFWTEQGAVAVEPPACRLLDPMFEPQTYLRMLGPEPWASVQTHTVLRPELAFLKRERFPIASLQVTTVIKGARSDAQTLVVDGLRALGFELEQRDVRFFDDMRRNTVLGLDGVGWRLVIDGVEAGWISFFQRAAAQSLDPVSLGVGLEVERLALLQQGTEGFGELKWGDGLRQEVLRATEEAELSRVFAHAPRDDLEERVSERSDAAQALVDDGLLLAALREVHAAVYEAYAAGARRDEGAASWQARLGAIVDRCAIAWLEERRRLGFPLGGATNGGADPGGLDV